MILDRELHPVERALAAWRNIMVPRDGVVLVAVSGGADSMALVEALRTDARRLVVAHFDHQLRADSARDAEHVAAYARAHGLAFVLGSDDVAHRARVHRASIEEAARDARYEFLTAAAERYHAQCVAIAHTRSDQIETILMRILRGSGRAGIAGIPERRGLFVRPLLDVARADTRDYCAERGVAFVDDPSNDDVRFFRNRVRHEILPALRSAFPTIENTLLRLADRARREQDAFAARTQDWLRENVREETPGVWVLELEMFTTLDDDDATSLLHDALVRMGLARDVDRAHYQRLLALVRDTHAGSSADLPGFSARREHDALVLRQTVSAHTAAFATNLAIPGRTRAGDWTIEADFVPADLARRAIASRELGSDVAYFDADAVATPLVVRPPQSGDRMQPFGMEGRKKLSDLFVDRKVPRRHRGSALVVEGDGILWVPGVASSEVGRIDDGTTCVVRLKAVRA